MTKLYELQDQLVQIDEVLANNTNPETEEILESAKEELLKTIDGKIENILDYISDCKAKQEQLKAEEERLAKKRKTLENKTEYLRNMLLGYMKANNKTKDSFGNWDITVARTAGKVVFDACDDKFPEWCKKYSWNIDKTLLKEKMVDGKIYTSDSNGDQILLAHIEEGESLRIK